MCQFDLEKFHQQTQGSGLGGACNPWAEVATFDVYTEMSPFCKISRIDQNQRPKKKTKQFIPSVSFTS